MVKDSDAIDVIEVANALSIEVQEGGLDPLDVLQATDRRPCPGRLEARRAHVQIDKFRGALSQLFSKEDQGVSSSSTGNQDSGRLLEVPLPPEAMVVDLGQPIDLRCNEPGVLIFGQSNREWVTLVLVLDVGQVALGVHGLLRGFRFPAPDW